MTGKPAKAVALTWGVKQSFRNYVQMTGGSSEVAAGASRTGGGEFTFAAARGETLSVNAEGGLAGQGVFLGEVRFEAHGGMLSVRIADPGIEVGPAGAVLTVADGGPGGGRVEIARLDLAAATSANADELVIPAALSMDGSRLLGDHYPPTTALDPVRLTLSEIRSN